MCRLFCKFVGHIQLGAKFIWANLASSKKCKGSSHFYNYTLKLNVKICRSFYKFVEQIQLVAKFTWANLARQIWHIAKSIGGSQQFYNYTLKLHVKICRSFYKFVGQIFLVAKFTRANLAPYKKCRRYSTLLQLYPEIACQDMQVTLQICRANLASCQIYPGKFGTQQ